MMGNIKLEIVLNITADLYHTQAIYYYRRKFVKFYLYFIVFSWVLYIFDFLLNQFFSFFFIQ